MLVSIITVALNSRSTLEGTIKSVLGQTYKDVEYIIIDGGSTDGTIEIIKSYNARIAKFISEPDKGIYDAMNKGIALAKGDVVGILNSDDIYANDRVIENVMERMTDLGVDCCYGDLVYVNAASMKVIRHWRANNYREGLFLKQCWTPPHPTFFVKASVYRRYGYFDTKYQIAADYDIMLRFLLDYNVSVGYVPETLIKMRVGGSSNRNLRNLCRKSFEDFQILRKHGVRFPFFALMAKNISKIPQFIHGKAISLC
jgi:glycosyltransferase